MNAAPTSPPTQVRGSNNRKRSPDHQPEGSHNSTAFQENGSPAQQRTIWRKPKHVLTLRLRSRQCLRVRTSPRPKRRQKKQEPASLSVSAVDESQLPQRSAGQSPRRSPPTNPVPSITPAKPAYAGPTFHASPAPSALPIPKFFSKSAPQSADKDGLQSQMDSETRENMWSPPHHLRSRHDLRPGKSLLWTYFSRPTGKKRLEEKSISYANTNSG